MRRLTLAHLVLLGTTALAAMPAAAAEYSLIQAGTVIAVPGAPARHNATLIVKDGRIASIADGFLTAAPGAGGTDHQRVLNLQAQTILPGLIDCHVHLTGQESPNDQLEAVTHTDHASVADGVLYAGRTLYAGFTTVRDAGGELQAVLALRDGIRKGEIKGPRMISAGEPLSATGGHADANGFRPDIFATPGPGICDGADACRRAVRYEVKYRVDWIKIMATGGVLDDSAAGTDQQFTDDELRAIMSTAHALGRKVAAHAHGLAGIRAAVLAGVDSIEHGTFLDDATAKLMHDRGTYLVPTLLAGQEVLKLAQNPDYFPPAVRAKALDVGAKMGTHVARAKAAGVKIAFGTDSAVSPHGENAQEFALLVKHGLTPVEAIQTATVNAAALLNLSAEIGTLEPGKSADVIAVAGDPVRDVTQLEHVTFVMKQGAVYKSPNLGEADGWLPSPPAER